MYATSTDEGQSSPERVDISLTLEEISKRGRGRLKKITLEKSYTRTNICTHMNFKNMNSDVLISPYLSTTFFRYYDRFYAGVVK